MRNVVKIVSLLMMLAVTQPLFAQAGSAIGAGRRVGDIVHGAKQGGFRSIGNGKVAFEVIMSEQEIRQLVHDAPFRAPDISVNSLKGAVPLNIGLIAREANGRFQVSQVKVVSPQTFGQSELQAQTRGVSNWQGKRVYKSESNMLTDLTTYVKSLPEPDHMVYLRGVEYAGQDQSPHLLAGPYKVYQVPARIEYFKDGDFQALGAEHVLVFPVEPAQSATVQFLTKAEALFRADPLRKPLPASFNPSAQFTSTEELWKAVGGKTTYPWWAVPNMMGDFVLFFANAPVKPIGEASNSLGGIVYDIYELPVEQIEADIEINEPTKFTRGKDVVCVRNDARSTVPWCGDPDDRWCLPLPAVRVIPRDQLAHEFGSGMTVRMFE